MKTKISIYGLGLDLYQTRGKVVGMAQDKEVSMQGNAYHFSTDTQVRSEFFLAKENGAEQPLSCIIERAYARGA